MSLANARKRLSMNIGEGISLGGGKDKGKQKQEEENEDEMIEMFSLDDEERDEEYDSDASQNDDNDDQRLLKNTKKRNAEQEKLAALIENTDQTEYNRLLNDSNLPPLEGISCWKYKPSNRYRIAVHKFVNHGYTKGFILFAIMLNCLVLAIDSPAAQDTLPETLQAIFNVFDLVVSIIFTIEMLLYMFALSTTIYLRDAWFRLDFIVVLSSWVGLVLGFNFQAFRALRALRPLKALKFFNGIRAILDSLHQSLKLLVDVLLFMVFFFFFFGITAIQLFQGSLGRRCVMNDTGEVAFPETFCSPRGSNKGHTCPSNQTCKDLGVAPNFGFTSFDNIILSFLTIFQCISLEGWTQIMYDVMDAEYEIAFLWFVLMVVLISFLVINLFVAVISATFSRVREQENRSAFVKARKEERKATMIVERNGKFYLEKKEEEASKPNPVWEALVEVTTCPDLPPDLVKVFAPFVDTSSSTDDESVNTQSTSERFDLFINVCIILNTVFLALEHHQMSPDFILMLNVAEYVFNSIFFIEMVIKILGMNGFRKYIRRNDNKFDFVIVLSTIPSLFFPNIDNTFVVLRLFRLLRVVRLMKRYPRLQKLLKTVLGSLIAITNLLAFMAFSLLVFAILGIQLFGGTYNFQPKPRENFDQFDDAVITLFIVLTGENWVTPFYDAMRGSASWAAPLFFIPFYLFANYILLNLFIAVILENFELTEAEKEALQRKLFWEKRGVGLAKSRTTQDRLLSFYNKHLGSQSNEAIKINGFSKELTANLPRRFVERYLMTEPILSKEKEEMYVRSLGMARAGHPNAKSSLSSLLRMTGNMGKADLANETLAETGGLTSLSVEQSDPRYRLRMRNNVVMDLMQNSEDSGPQQVTYQQLNPRKVQKIDLNEATAAAEIANETEGDMDGMIMEDADSDSDVEEKELLAKLKMFGHRNKGNRDPEETDGNEKEANQIVSAVMMEEDTYDKSLFCLTTSNPIRKWCIKIVDNRWFDHLILVVIVVSSVFLAMENPQSKKDPVFSVVSYNADLCFLVIFTVELVLKVIANGIWLTPQSYLSSSWNRLDAIVLVFSYLAFFAGDSVTFGSVGRAFRIGRALRPLRFINRNEGMKDIINSLIESRRDIFNVVMLWISFLTIFAILGINLFSGLYYRCNDPSVVGKSDCVGTFTSELGILVQRVWSNPPYSFDDFPSAMLTLFEVSSLEGWINVMYGAMDMVGPDMNPRTNATKLNSIYFIVFIFIGSFFVVKLFVGVIIDNFSKINGSSRMTNAQKRWLDMRKVMIQIRPTKRPPRPRSSFRAALFDIIAHPSFDKFIMGVILINVLLMATETRNMTKEWDELLQFANWTFLFIFSLEMVIKVLALNLKNYLRSGWNVFDASVVIGSLIFEFANLQNFPLRRNAFIRAFRILRIVRIIRSAKGLRTLFNTLLTSLPSMLNVGALLVLCIFVYAVMGVQLFGEVKYGHFTKRHANFNHIGVAFLTLFRVLTGEDWNGVMHDVRVTYPNCSGSDCGYFYVAPVYFISFFILGAYVFLNLLIAVILENFSYCYNKEVSIISERDLDRFKRVWLEYDPKAKGYIRLHHLLPFLRNIGPPMGMQVQGIKQKWMYLRLYYECRHKILRRMRMRGYFEEKIPRRFDRVKFRTLLLILARRIVGLEALEFERKLRREQQLERLDQEIAATMINAAARGFLLRRKLYTLMGSSKAYKKLAQGYMASSFTDPKRFADDEHESSDSDDEGMGMPRGRGLSIARRGVTRMRLHSHRTALDLSSMGTSSENVLGATSEGSSGSMSVTEMFESPAQRRERMATISRGSLQNFVTRLANHADRSMEEEEETAERGRFIEDFYLDEFLHPMEDRFVPINRTQASSEASGAAIQSLKSLNARVLTVEEDSDSEYDSDGGSSPMGSPRGSPSRSPGSPSLASQQASKSKWKAIRERAKKGTLSREKKEPIRRTRGRTRSDSLYGDQGVIYDLGVVSGGSEKKRAFISQLEKWEDQLEDLEVDEDSEGQVDDFSLDIGGDTQDARELNLSSGPGWAGR